MPYRGRERPGPDGGRATLFDVATLDEGLRIGFELDRRWHLLRQEMESPKEPDLRALARVLAEAGIPYALIGGIALQVHQREPRTTIDIDVAVPDRAGLPRATLEKAGFALTGRFEHSQNWLAPGGTPVQFTDDPALRESLTRTVAVPLLDVVLRVVAPADLLAATLRAAKDPAPRRAKRLQDLADAQTLLEQEPALETKLSPEDRAVLRSLP